MTDAVVPAAFRGGGGGGVCGEGLLLPLPARIFCRNSVEMSTCRRM
jgi:hypothetical protein